MSGASPWMYKNTRHAPRISKHFLTACWTKIRLVKCLQIENNVCVFATNNCECSDAILYNTSTTHSYIFHIYFALYLINLTCVFKSKLIKWNHNIDKLNWKNRFGMSRSFLIQYYIWNLGNSFIWRCLVINVFIKNKVLN